MHCFIATDPPNLKGAYVLMESNIILLFLVLFPMIGVIVSYLIGRENKTHRDSFIAVVTITEFLILAYLLVTFQEEKKFLWKGFCSMGLYLKLDGFRLLFGLIVVFMWMMITLFSREYFVYDKNRSGSYLFTLLILGATLGVFLSGNLVTIFLFLEILSICIYIWIAKGQKSEFPTAVLFADSLTKSVVFGIITISSQVFMHDENWGKILLGLGIMVMFLGAFLAVLSTDLKRILFLSSISQIGYILVGIGMQGIQGEHNALAVRGTILHVLNYSLILLLFVMSAGVIVMHLHKSDLNCIRGFGREKPLLQFCFGMGALGIMGIPLWNGYISNTLLHESIVEHIKLLEALGKTEAANYKIAEWMFLFTGGLTIAYLLKLYVAIFIEKNPYRLEQVHDSKKYMSKMSIFAMVASAVILPILGAFPYVTMNKLADLGQEFMHGQVPIYSVHYFTFSYLKGALISIVIGVVVYIVMIRFFLMKTDENGNKMYRKVWNK